MRFGASSSTSCEMNLAGYRNLNPERNGRFNQKPPVPGRPAAATALASSLSAPDSKPFSASIDQKWSASDWLRAFKRQKSDIPQSNSPASSSLVVPRLRIRRMSPSLRASRLPATGADNSTDHPPAENRRLPGLHRGTATRSWSST